MFTKKITHQVILLLCIGELSTALAIEANNAQVSPLSQEADVIDHNEHTIIAVGGASYGTVAVTGTACVVTKRKQLKKVRPGDIVVAHEINSLWYAGLRTAKGLIIEKGDSASHALALGKKLGIPVIVGATGATKNIIDGQMITCDPVTRNVYHVAYPDHRKEVHFDALHMPQKDNKYQMLHDKLVNNTSNDLSKKYDSAEASEEFVDRVAVVGQNNNVLRGSSEYRAKRITKDIYDGHFNQFKKFALKTQGDYKWAKSWGILEKGARLTGRDQFTIDCMAIGDVLLSSDESHLVEVLKRIGEEKYIQYMDILIDKCTKRPKNIKEVNWIARVSHEEHIKNIDMPAEINKNILIEHPKEYKKIEDIVDEEDMKNLVGAGIFALYWMETVN